MNESSPIRALTAIGVRWQQHNAHCTQLKPARPLKSPAEVTMWGSSWMQAGKPSLRQRISRCNSPAYLKYCLVSLRKSKRWSRRKWHWQSATLAREQAEGEIVS